MASVEDLPQFFRGGELARIISAFQNQVNNNFNFYVHDIIGAYRKGEISKTNVAYKVMFSHVLPALLFGMIGRGGLPKDWKQVATDIITYPIASLMLVGRLINRMIQGWGNSGTIVSTAERELSKTAKAVKKGDAAGIIKGAAKTIGALRGGPTAQMFRTIEGVGDMAAGDTKDPRRLVYSQWALDQGKKAKPTSDRNVKRAVPKRAPIRRSN